MVSVTELKRGSLYGFHIKEPELEPNCIEYAYFKRANENAEFEPAPRFRNNDKTVNYAKVCTKVGYETIDSLKKSVPRMLSNEIGPLLVGGKKPKKGPKIHIGPKGGKYYIKNGNKVYI